jgi:hypothetical protein
MMETAQPKKTRRKLSRFLCQEMLYDYVSDTLDPDRREAIREFLASDEQSREELECLREGLSYAEKLSHTNVSLPLLEKLKRSQSIPAKTLSRLSWRHLPMPLRLGIEALGVSIAVAIVMSSIPWGQLHLFRRGVGQVEIAQVEHKQTGEQEPVTLSADNPSEPVTEDNTKIIAEAATPSNGPQAGEDGEENAPKVEAAAATKVVVKAPPPPPPAAVPALDTKPLLAKTDVKPALALAAAASTGKKLPLPAKQSAVPPSAVLGPGAVEVDPKTAGTPADAKHFIFKVFMRMGKLDDVSPKVADALRAQGAERAGEVELGWRRPTGSYYHFTLPETNYEAAIKGLQSFGPVRIFREPHQRVMPQGKIRFILWIEDEK